MENNKEIYLKLTKDEIETIKYALNFQNDVYSSNSLNHDGSENDDLVAKIYSQEDTICRPYVVSGKLFIDMFYAKMKVVVMAEDAESALEYAKENIRNRGGFLTACIEDVHEMRDDEFLAEVECGKQND